MTNYAYLDVQGLLRIVEKKEWAEESAKFNGKIVTTQLPCIGGVPSMFNKGTQKDAEVWVFAVGEAYFEPRQVQGGELRMKQYPELLDIFLLYRELEGAKAVERKEAPKISKIVNK